VHFDVFTYVFPPGVMVYERRTSYLCRRFCDRNVSVHDDLPRIFWQDDGDAALLARTGRCRRE